MKIKMIFSLFFLSILFFSPMSYGDTSQNKNQTQEQKMQTKNDGEVIAWIEAIDNFEVNAAQVASTKNIDSAVKEYVTMLANDHSKNLKQAIELSSELGENPVETRALNKFKQGGTKQLKKLSKENNNFQKDFIDAMVSGHADALQKVDDDLMKKVSNDKLKSLLQETRDMIAHHLELAKEIQKKM